MKTTLQFLKSYCLLSCTAVFLLISSGAKAQGCCGWAAEYDTVTGCNTIPSLGASGTCPGLGWFDCGTCPTGATYTWAPVSHLSNTHVKNPSFTWCQTGTSDFTYTVTVNSTSGCTPATYTVGIVHVHASGCCANCCRIGHFDNPKDTSADAGIRVFPNPSSGNVSVAFDEIQATTDIEVYDLYGALVLKKTNIPQNEKQVDLDLRKVAKGIYYVQVTRAGSGVFNKKVLIQ